MKKLTKFFPAILFVLLITCFTSLQAQTVDVYDDGTVWEVSFIKTMPNEESNYLEGLAGNWIKMMAEAKKQGLITSYKVLSGSASNPEDFDIMLMVEYKNMAAMEGEETSKKWDAIALKAVGDDDAMEMINQKRLGIRTIYGSKLLREIMYK